MIENLISHADLLDNLSEGVYFTDKNRQILFWNKGAESLTGYASRDVVGSHCWDNILLHVDEQGNSLCRGLCPLVRAMKEQKPVTTLAFMRHKAGHRVSVTIRSMPIRDAAGEIIGAVEMFSDASSVLAMQSMIDELRKMAMVDPLTGLANRRFTENSLASRLEERHRYGRAVGISFLDIDHFKAVNDAHGHETGDDVLRLIARTLMHNSRPFDLPGRWGGEELLVVSVNVDAAGLTTVAERYRRLIEASSLPAAGSIRVTVSIGATMAQDGDTTESIVGRADRLMYQSKRDGRNRVTCG